MKYKYYAEVEFDNMFGSYGNGNTQKEAIDNCKFYLATDYHLKAGAKIVGELFKLDIFKNKEHHIYVPRHTGEYPEPEEYL